MNQATAALAFLLCVAACAGSVTPGGFEPVWSQRAEEAGRLPIGRVVAVELVNRAGEVPAADDAPLARPSAGASVTAELGGVLARTARTPLRIVRHAVRLGSGAMTSVDAEYRHQVGDCVAIRPGAAGSAPALVTALPGECR